MKLLRLCNLIVIGTIIRLILMPFTAHPIDVYIWNKIILEIIREPLSITYFPPMLSLTFVPIAFFYRIASNFLNIKPISFKSLPAEIEPDPRYEIGYITDPSFNMLVKVPFLISDILVTVIIFRLIENLSQDRKKALWASSFWFLNPYLILISSVWGMFDTLPTLFSLASILLLLYKRVNLSALTLAIAFAYKLYPILFLIPTILFIRRFEILQSTKKAAIRYLIVFFAFSIILFLPVISKVFIFSHTLFIEPPETEVYGFGLTFWSILLMIPLNQIFVVIVSNLIVILFLFATYLKAFRSKFEYGFLDLMSFQLCGIFSIFAGFRFVCEQFLVWALPYLLILGCYGKVKILNYKLLSIIAFTYTIIHGLNGLFFFLPTWPWLGDFLLWAVRLIRGTYSSGVMQGIQVITQPHISVITLTLSILGIIFTSIMTLILLNILHKLHHVNSERKIIPNVNLNKIR